MSIHSSFNMGDLINFDSEPEWMRAERYDYCEQQVEITENKNWFSRIISLFR